MPRNIHGKPTGRKNEESKSEDGKMKHMARSKEEKSEDGIAMPAEAGPDYPYGLRIHLDHEALEKHGIKELPKAGEEMHFKCKAHVHSATSEKRDGEERNHLELQITHMGIHHKPDDMEAEESEPKPRKRH